MHVNRFLITSRKEIPLKNPDLTILIPCHNEEYSIATTVENIASLMLTEKINHEILCVDNSSTDKTASVINQLQNRYENIRYTKTPPIPGYGVAVRWGLEEYKGKYVVIVMADGSENPMDILKFYKKIDEGFDCIFGTRFSGNGTINNYPWFKLLLNRWGNKLIALATSSQFNDFTNGFKCYRRELIDKIKPLYSEKFNLTIEMSINAVLENSKIIQIPNDWKDRDVGHSKFNILKQSWLYCLTIIFCLIKNKIKGKPIEETNSHHIIG